MRSRPRVMQSTSRMRNGLRLGRYWSSVLAVVVTMATAPMAEAQNARQELSAESVIETIKRRGAVTIGLSLFVPWSMRDRNGELIGFEVDVGRKLAEDMGVEAEFVPTAWDGIIPALVSGKFDVIISGLSITPQRNLTVNFTQPYAYTGATILANRQLTEGFSVEDFNSPEVTFAARRGGTRWPVRGVRHRRRRCRRRAKQRRPRQGEGPPVHRPADGLLEAPAGRLSGGDELRGRAGLPVQAQQRAAPRRRRGGSADLGGGRRSAGLTRGRLRRRLWRWRPCRLRGGPTSRSCSGPR